MRVEVSTLLFVRGKIEVTEYLNKQMQVAYLRTKLAVTATCAIYLYHSKHGEWGYLNTEFYNY